MGSHRVDPDEQEERGGFGQEERPHPDGKGHEVEIIAAVGKDDVPFDDRDEPKEEHENPQKITLVHPGGTFLLAEGGLEKNGVSDLHAENSQEGHAPDDLLLHLVLEVDDVVLEKAMEEMTGEDGELAEPVSQRGAT